MFLLSIYYDMFCPRPVAACFVVDLLRRIVVLSTVNFFVGFALIMTKFDLTKSSN